LRLVQSKLEFKTMLISLLTLGCKLNYAETSTYQRGLEAGGHQVVSWHENADVYIINTCTVTATADSKSRNLIRKVHRVNPAAAIIVTGCSAQLRRQEIQEIPGVTRIFGAQEKDRLVPFVCALTANATLTPSAADATIAAAAAASAATAASALDATAAETAATTTAASSTAAATAAAATAAATTTAAATETAAATAVAETAAATACGQSVPVPSPACCPDKLPDTSLHGRLPDGVFPACSNGVFPAGSSDKLPDTSLHGRLPDGVFPAYSTDQRTRSFLKVQDGCSNFCAYCTVPFARGLSRNIPIAECVRNARDIASHGIKEIVITGVNTGDFGKTTGESFLDLLKALNDVEGIERYRISSIEPNLITTDIIEWAASGTKIQPHLHIPLQTGSDVQLKRMGRRYDTALFAEKIACIREAFDVPVFFGLDTMVGLPGENDELFRCTYDFIASIKPAFIHVFPYSRRPGTKAWSMPDQVSEATKHERVMKLEELSNSLYDSFVTINKGRKTSVLWESKEKDGMMSGYTDNYIRVFRTYDKTLVGNITEIIL